MNNANISLSIPIFSISNVLMYIWWKLQVIASLGCIKDLSHILLMSTILKNLDKLEKPSDDLPIHLYTSPDASSPA